MTINEKEPIVDSNVFENHLPEENINVSKEHPLKEFGSLVLAGLLIAGVFIALLAYLSTWLAPHIPFEYETALTERFDSTVFEELKSDSAEDTLNDLSQHRGAYLQTLAEKYTQKNPLPEGMTITVHYINDETVNAFATLGGHIFIHGGLFNVLKTENALMFVLGHEIGHVVERHPISSMGRAVIIAVALTSFLGISDSVLPDWLFGNTVNMTMLSFSRDQENAADQYSLRGLNTIYGHVSGASEFFKFLIDEDHESSETRLPIAIELLQTHPLHESRLRTIENFDDDLPAKEVINIPEEIFSLEKKG